MANTPAPPTMSRREIEEKIVALAWRDDDFRQKFLADPKRQFEEKLDIKLPASLRMTAYAEDANHLHFVIPAKPAGIKELSDEELEKVAGGVTPAMIVTLASVSLAAIATATVSNAAGGAWDKK
jgi:hypothetical protein